MAELLAGLPAAGIAKRRTTPDHVADAIRDAIHNGQLTDGVELNQVALAEHFTVSRVPIREALRQLQAEGLVRQEAHRRAMVTTLTPDRIEELFDVRILLERYLLERAVTNMEGDTIGRLEVLAADMADLDDHNEWLEANRELHAGLYAPAHALYTQELAAQIAAKTTRYLFQRSGGQGIAAHDQAQHEHERILEALRQGDVDSACRALEQHIEGTRVRVRDFLRERDEGLVNQTDVDS